MEDHEYLMSDGWASTLDSIRKAVAVDEDDSEREDSTLDELVLGVDTKVVRDVMLGVGGPTRFLRFVLDSHDDSSAHIVLDEVRRVEYHDSWASIDYIILDEAEEREAIDAFGWMVGFLE